MNSALPTPPSALAPLACPTFPARPVNGGPLPKARPKTGRWFYEPKVNGWRALVHVPSGIMFNRQGERLSIEREFVPVLDQLKQWWHEPRTDTPPSVTWPLWADYEWLDCEAFARRHPLGKGSLILLDLPQCPGTYEDRMRRVYELIEIGLAASWAHEQFLPPLNHLLTFAYSYQDGDDTNPAAAWLRLQNLNVALNCELFEGLVAKRADSLYPLQRRSPDEEFTGWMKHRWSF